MNNINKRISKRNMNILKENHNSQNVGCNCRDRSSCLLNEDGLIGNVMYKAIPKKNKTSMINDSTLEQ